MPLVALAHARVIVVMLNLFQLSAAFWSLHLSAARRNGTPTMAKIEAAEAPEELMDLSHLDKDEDQSLMYPECRYTRAIAFHDCGMPLVSEPGVSVYTRACI